MRIREIIGQLALFYFWTKGENTTHTPGSVAKILGIYNGVSYLAIVYIASIQVRSWEVLLSVKTLVFLQMEEP